MRSFEQAFAQVLKLVNVVCGGLICVMSLHIVADVAGRYLFSAPISGTSEFVQYYYMVGVIFLPLPYLQLRRLHFAATVFTERLPPPLIRAIVLLADAATAVLCAVAAWQSLRVAMSKTAVGEHIMTAHMIVLQWPARWLVVFGFALMSLAAAIGVIDGIRRPGAAPLSAPLDDPRA
jgi:TRAP-type C4-dicarboxylate transport system permease small subunit